MRLWVLGVEMKGNIDCARFTIVLLSARSVQGAREAVG